jgi:pyrimidine-nucleoside phosphorylase
MDVPLGFAVGNRIEVWEAIQVLQGRGEPRLREICISLASNIVALAQNIDTPSAKAMVENAISNGLAFEKMKEWIKCQGGDVSYLESPDILLGAKYKKAYIAKKDGYISKLQADKIGIASALLGAGRVKLEDQIDYNAGIIFEKSYGDYVHAGDTIATLYSDKNAFDVAERELDDAIITSDQPPLAEELIANIL